MRKNLIFFGAAALVMALASCSKVENVEKGGSSEIAIKALNNLQTKAVIEGTTFPAANEMQIAAQYDNGGVYSTYFGDNSGVTFAKKEAVWAGKANPYFWPLEGSMNFLALSSSTAIPAATFTFDDAAVSGLVIASVETYKGSDAADNQDDLLFSDSATQACAGKNTAAVPMTFNHATAWLFFNVKCSLASTADMPIVINSITVNGVKTAGSLEVTAGTPSTAEWTLSGTAAGKLVPQDDVLEFAAADTQYAIGNGILLPEQAQSSFTIDYTIGDNENMKYTYDFDSSETWEMGKKYTYNISLTLNEITVSPSVNDWGTVADTDVEI